MRDSRIACLVVAGCCAVWAQAPAEGGLLLRGGTVHTISGPVIENGSVLVRNGKIIGVGKNLTAPPGFQAIDLKGQQVYPGMIDAASFLGLDAPSPEEATDAQELGLLNPQLRAGAAVNPSSEQIAAARANGVTSVVVMPEGELLSGQMSLVHLDGSSNDAMSVIPSAAIHLRFPAIATTPIPPHESDDDDDDPAALADAAPIPYAEAKRDYDQKIKALDDFFEEARRYRQARLARRPSFRTELKYEAMLPVLEGAKPLFVTAVREREIREAIAFAVRERIKIVLADAYESYKVTDLIRAHKIPVVLGPTLSLPLDRDDPYDRSYTIPAELFQAGIKFAIGTFSARRTQNLPYQAAAAVAYGLPQDEAYKVVSLNAAEIFGAGNRLGSIAEGKTADLIVTDGDPLDVRTHVNMLFIGGKAISLDTRQKQLYEKYSKQF